MRGGDNEVGGDQSGGTARKLAFTRLDEHADAARRWYPSWVFNRFATASASNLATLPPKGTSGDNLCRAHREMRSPPTAQGVPPPQHASMPPNQSSHAWIARFCARMLQLRPEVRIRVAIRRAVTACAYVGDMRPEEAAGVDAVRLSQPLTAAADPIRLRAFIESRNSAHA